MEPTWLGESSGLFSVKSAYSVLKTIKDTNLKNGEGECSDKSKMVSFWRKLWRLKIQDKVKIFIWRLYHNFIPVGVNLTKRGIISKMQCGFYMCPNETPIHVFYECWWARAFWNYMEMDQILFSVEM